MDWFSWLSRTGLEPTLVYEYGLSFQQNELEEDDVSYFNHEFLQSMGISIAKHRLEILKLARKRNGSGPRPVSRILASIKRRLSKHLRPWLRREESALAIVPSARLKSATAKRSKRVVMVRKNSSVPLLITDGGGGSRVYFRGSRVDSFSSPLEDGDHIGGDDDDDGKKDDGDGRDEYWSSAVEEIRWDAMFQNLKPT